MGSHHARRRGPVRDLVAAHLLEQLDELRQHAGAAAEGEVGAVHRVRTTARRLRSVLSAFGSTFEPGATDEVVDDLRWLGSSFSAARDAHVLRAHLAEVLAGQPAELVVDAVASRVDLELGLAERDGGDEARAAVGSDRFQRLTTGLQALAESGPWSEEAERPATTVARGVVADAAASLRRAVRAASAGEADRDVALHRVRKRAKRLRYAAECARPALGRRSARLAKRAKGVQAALGDYQDSVVARVQLRQIGIAAHLDGMNAFTFGRLHGLEELRAERSLHAYEEAGQRLPRHVKRWLRH